MTYGDPKPTQQLEEQNSGQNDVESEATWFSINGLHPKEVVSPSNIKELSRDMEAFSEANLAVAPWGGGTRVEVGNVINRLDAVVKLSGLNRVIQHNSSDLTVTVEGGMTIANIQETLAHHGQFLPIDPPIPHLSSIGGTLATAVSGPLKWHYGNPRDLVLGMKIVHANGQIAKSGGQVVKNVTGYDMPKLHIGALGTLGIIVEVSFKLIPLPHREKTLVAAFQSDKRCFEAARDIFHSPATPLALTALDSNANKQSELLSLPGKYFLLIRLGGRPLSLERELTECTALVQQKEAASIETLDKDTADSLWRKVADFGWDENTSPVISARVSLLPSNIPELTVAMERSEKTGGLHPAIISHPGYGNAMINWYADSNCNITENVSKTLVQTLDTVHQIGGRMIIEQCPTDIKAQFDVWDLTEQSMDIMRRMKEQYDPNGILNPGRLAGDIR